MDEPGMPEYDTASFGTDTTVADPDVEEPEPEPIIEVNGTLLGPLETPRFIGVWLKKIKQGDKYLWEASEWFEELTEVLDKEGFKKEWLLNEPGERCRKCIADGNQRNKVKVNNDGHMDRHVATHFPNGIGFFTCCPACGFLTKRTDMFSYRHSKTCSARLSRNISRERLKTDGVKNVFLR
jgi:hypothetical protein